MLLATLGGIAALLLAYGAATLSASLRARARIRRRIDGFSQLASADDDDAAQAVSEMPAMRTPSRTGVLDRRYPLAGGVRTATVALAAGVVGAVLLLALLVFFRVPVPVAIIVAIAVGGVVGYNVGTAQEARQRRTFEERFVVVIEDFQRMVHFGISPPRAFASVAEAAEEPVRTPLRNVANALELGVPLGPALETEAQRIRIRELAMMAAILGTQAQSGGDLSEATANLADMLRTRLNMRTQMGAATAESRMTLIILTIVPVVAIAMQWALQPELFDAMIGESRHLLGIGMALIVAGLLVAGAMTRSVRP